METAVVDKERNEIAIREEDIRREPLLEGEDERVEDVRRVLEGGRRRGAHLLGPALQLPRGVRPLAVGQDELRLDVGGGEGRRGEEDWGGIPHGELVEPGRDQVDGVQARQGGVHGRVGREAVRGRHCAGDCERMMMMLEYKSILAGETPGGMRAVREGRMTRMTHGAQDTMRTDPAPRALACARLGRSLGRGRSRTARAARSGCRSGLVRGGRSLREEGADVGSVEHVGALVDAALDVGHDVKGRAHAGGRHLLGVLAEHVGVGHGKACLLQPLQDLPGGEDGPWL